MRFYSKIEMNMEQAEFSDFSIYLNISFNFQVSKIKKQLAPCDGVNVFLVVAVFNRVVWF